MINGNYVLGMMKPSTEGRGESAGERKKMLPPNVTVVSGALGIRDLVPEQLTSALSRIEVVAAELAAKKADVITMGGTPPVVFGGYGFDRKIVERINKVTPIPATTSQTSSVEAIRKLGAKKLVIVTPFKDYVNQLVAKFMEASGFVVVSFQTANAPFEQFPKMTLSVSYDLAVKGVKAAPDAECIYIPCSAWPVSDNIEPLEKATGIPVVASTQSGLWGALRLMGVKTKVQGYGRLFREF